MGWIGKAVGGTLGFIVGGPVGAAIGTGIGHGVDALDEESGNFGGRTFGRDLDAEALFLFDDVGLAVKLETKTSLPTGSVGLLRVLNDSGEILKGKKPFQDDDGDFFVTSPIVDRTGHFYLPLGALRYVEVKKYGIMCTAVTPNANGEQPTVLGTAVFEIELPAPRPWVKAQWLSPLIGLCMEVVHADGKVLPEEVRMVRTYFQEVFELEPVNMESLKTEMKKKPSGNLQELIETATLRLPGLTPPDILSIMADVSKCDGEVHEREVEVIRRAALLMGLPQEDWAGVASELGLSDHRRQRYRASNSGMSISDAQKVLGISNDASPAEIQAAYRKLVADYHPDRVAFMPKEFQDLAHQKMTEINAAYARVK